MLLGSHLSSWYWMQGASRSLQEWSLVLTYTETFMAFLSLSPLQKLSIAGNKKYSFTLLDSAHACEHWKFSFTYLYRIHQSCSTKIGVYIYQFDSSYVHLSPCNAFTGIRFLCVVMLGMRTSRTCKSRSKWTLRKRSWRWKRKIIR